MNSTRDTKKNQIGSEDGLMKYPPQKISQQEAIQLGNDNFLPAVPQKP